MAKVIITGANGFLGSWLSRSLLNLGHEVTVLIRKNSDISDLTNLKLNFIYGDILNQISLEEAFKNQDAVFHLAGLIAYKKSDREKMEQVNVQGTANVIQACLNQKVHRLIHLSSVVAIGSSFSEDQILNENSKYNIHHLDLGYFETKRKAEELVVNAVKNQNLDAVILNPSTIYGAGDAKKGSRGSQLKVAQGRFPFYTSGGVNVVAVEDVVYGIIRAWEVGKKGERYILSGDNISIKTLFSMIAKEAGVKPPQYQIPDSLLHLLGIWGDFMSRLGMKGPISRENAWTATMYHWFDNTKAKAELGFNPRSANFAIENSVKWMKENGLLERRN